MNFIAERPFTYLHAFSYSQRPGTKAAALPNQVPGGVIKRRARELRRTRGNQIRRISRLANRPHPAGPNLAPRSA